MPAGRHEYTDSSPRTRVKLAHGRVSHRGFLGSVLVGAVIIGLALTGVVVAIPTFFGIPLFP